MKVSHGSLVPIKIFKVRSFLLGFSRLVGSYAVFQGSKVPMKVFYGSYVPVKILKVCSLL